MHTMLALKRWNIDYKGNNLLTADDIFASCITELYKGILQDEGWEDDDDKILNIIN